MKTLGEKLQKLRLERGWSRQYVYERTNVAICQQSLMERDLRIPTLATLNRLAILYDLDAPQLLENVRPYTRRAFFDDPD